MFGQKKKAARLAFSEGILTTFGKLDQQDIAQIEGQSARLVSHLIDQYGWSADFAQTKVDGFCTYLSDERMRFNKKAAR